MRTTAIKNLKQGKSAFVRECDGLYAVWDGHRFIGSIERQQGVVSEFWMLYLPGGPPEGFVQFRAAVAEARDFVSRYYGGEQ